MDLVYIVRPGDDNEELRYSLRSLVNFTHATVWIVGHRPEWVRNVRSIELVPRDEKWANIRQSLEAVCACEAISEDFVLMNDDMFVMHPIESLPVTHLGPLDDFISAQAADGQTVRNSWFTGLLMTYLQMGEWGHVDALAYEGHTPLPFNRRELGRLLARATRSPLLWGCLYSATSGPAGILGDNVKVGDLGASGLLRRLALGSPFLSTEDAAFSDGAIGDFIRNAFPDPGPYEEAS